SFDVVQPINPRVGRDLRAPPHIIGGPAERPERIASPKADYNASIDYARAEASRENVVVKIIE
ncbi:hypothetical protein NKG95_32415, partial [Mesorhizobium sp. M1423]|uniref:hypothetical protein n=1 Tax=Mesorhizobium sp. M1423 TaxID=2957101 RepID=UPI00333C34D7